MPPFLQICMCFINIGHLPISHQLERMWLSALRTKTCIQRPELLLRNALHIGYVLPPNLSLCSGMVGKTFLIRIRIVYFKFFP